MFAVTFYTAHPLLSLARTTPPRDQLSIVRTSSIYSSVCWILFSFRNGPTARKTVAIPPSMPGHATHFRSFPNPIKSENWNCCVYVRMCLCVSVFLFRSIHLSQLDAILVL